MNTLRLLLVLSFLLVIVAVFQTGFLQKSTPLKTPTTKDVLQQKTEVHEPTPTSPLPSPTSLSSPSPLHEESASSFFYPGAELVEETSDSVIYWTTDAPEKVTEWYKNKIISDGFTTKTFVRTKANEKVENVLVGSQDDQQIRIEITKKDINSPTIITVVR